MIAALLTTRILRNRRLQRLRQLLNGSGPPLTHREQIACSVGGFIGVTAIGVVMLFACALALGVIR